MLLPTTAVVVSVSSLVLPGQVDLPAAIGAALSTVIALGEARKSDRSNVHMASVAIASFTLGSTVPGAYMLNFHFELATRWTWHSWAMSGFLVGIFGWTVVVMLMRVVPDVILGWINRKIGMMGGSARKDDEKEV